MTMTTTIEELHPVRDAVDSYAKAYGPFAFGVITLLILWYTIMSPELASNRLDFETHRKLLEKQGENNHAMESVARTMNETAVILDRITQRIERLEDAVSSSD